MRYEYQFEKSRASQENCFPKRARWIQESQSHGAGDGLVPARQCFTEAIRGRGRPRPFLDPPCAPGLASRLARIFHNHFCRERRSKGRDGALRRTRRVQRRNTSWPRSRIHRSEKRQFRACAASLPPRPCERSGLGGGRLTASVQAAAVVPAFLLARSRPENLYRSGVGNQNSS